jgi:hypothetical protein
MPSRSTELAAGFRSRVGLLVALVLAAPTGSPSRADVGPPAHLRISEHEPGSIVTQWRVPRILPPRAVPVPELPDTCEPVGRYSVDEQAGAWLFSQDWRCDSGLAGEIVGLRFPFAEMALTTVVRVELLSGDRFANVLTPGGAPWRLPQGTATPDRLREAADAVLLGLGHAFGSWVHLGFVLAAGLLGGVHRSVRVVTAFSLGQLVGLGAGLLFPGFEIVPAEIVVAVTAALLAREALRAAEQRRRLIVVTAAGGAVHGLAVGALAAGGLGENAAGTLAQLLTLLGMDAAHLVGATVVSLMAAAVTPERRSVPIGRGLAYISGSAGIALALGLALGGEATNPRAAPPGLPSLGQQTTGSAGTAPGSRRLAAAVPDAPIQSFLVVEPFEVRQEVMLRLGGLAATLGLAPDSVVQVPEQAELSRRLTAFVLDATTLQVDGETLPGNPRRADFMTVDATGALPRSTPVPERVADSFVGVVIAYPTSGMPGEASLSWDPLPGATGVIPTTAIDPETVVTATLTPAEPTLIWKNALIEDPIPEISAVAVEPRRLPVPLLSLPLLAAGVVLLILGLSRRRFEAAAATARVILALAIAVGPVARTTLALPASTSGVPSERQARRILAGLLPNIYRAMEFGDEPLIYDRLAISVTGDALTEIYLQQRRTLEMEERGGAQARVEAVEILDATEVARQGDGFGVRATWTAAGMVTHFGHRHFRQNRYDANIAITPADGTWKIREVEILEQERLK